MVKKKPGGSSTPSKTPTTKRRSSLPNGEGLGLRENALSTPTAIPSASAPAIHPYCYPIGLCSSYPPLLLSHHPLLQLSTPTAIPSSSAPVIRPYRYPIILCSSNPSPEGRVDSCQQESIYQYEAVSCGLRAGEGGRFLHRGNFIRIPQHGGHLGAQAYRHVDSDGLVFHYWALFDGHAGSGAAVVASRLLQHHIVEQLREVLDILRNSALLPPTCLGEEPNLTPGCHRALTRAASLRGAAGAPGSPGTPPTRFFTEKKGRGGSDPVGGGGSTPERERSVGQCASDRQGLRPYAHARSGAKGQQEADAQIEREKSVYNISGGCTALVVVFLMGKLYVANAGDSRAIIIRSGEVIPMSTEFTPESERQRLQFL
ncbi:hypothetical protein JZ751_005568, partial [Albula glossodonta]